MMRIFLITPLLWMLALPAWADARMSVLMDLLKMPEVATILIAEDRRYAEDLNAEWLGGQGGAPWAVQVDAILDPARLTETVRRGLAAELEGETLEQVIAFYASDLGQRIVDFENSGRAAIGDPDIEAAARLRFAQLEGSKDPKLALITRLVEEGDMIDHNVTGALNSNFQFLRGLVDGNAVKMSEAEILTDVQGQTEEITQDTTEWLYAFLLMAYSPLSVDDLETYVAFAGTPAGLALNRGLFEGFGASYEDISYGFGRAIGINMVAEDI